MTGSLAANNDKADLQEPRSTQLRNANSSAAGSSIIRTM